MKNSTSYLNLTNSSYTIQTTQHLKPIFSVSIYFIIMLLLLCCSVLAFSFLNHSKTAKQARKTFVQNSNDIDLSNTQQINDDVFEQTSQIDLVPSNKNEKKRKLTMLLCMTFAGSFIQYGYLPGLLSYSTIPYGNYFFHLSINLSKIFLFRFFFFLYLLIFY
jgi:hypothetical protein